MITICYLRLTTAFSHIHTYFCGVMKSHGKITNKYATNSLKAKSKNKAVEFLTTLKTFRTLYVSRNSQGFLHEFCASVNFRE